MKRALIFEVNPYHQVMFPGVIEYLITCNYNVSLLVREGIDCNDIFERYKGSFDIHFYSDNSLKSVCDEMGGINSFNYIFFSSLEYYHDGIFESAYDYLSKYEKIKIPFAGIIHNPDKLKNINSEWMIEKGRVLSLSENNCNRNFNLCIPTTFGDRIINVVRTNKVLMVGQSNDINYVARQIQECLDKGINDIEVLCVGNFDTRKIFAKYIVKRIINWGMTLVGKEKKYRVDYSIKVFNKINFLGKLSYSNLFRQLEECSFVDIAIDPDADNQFYTGRTTGTLLLAYGFNKPCILEKRFADAYGLLQSESVVYKSNTLGFVTAMQMTDEEYLLMLKAFEKKIEDVKKESIDSIMKTIT